MSESQARTSDRRRLFAVAEQSVAELKQYIAGQRELTPAQVEVKAEFVRQASAESFYFFAKVVLGYNKMTNQTHKKWADELQAKWRSVDFFMRLKPRGTYKTTLYGISFLLWVWACVTPELRFFYTSANGSLLDEVSAELDRFIGEKAESVYALVFGIRRDPAAKNTADVFNIKGRLPGKGFSLTFRTAGGATNGVHPHFIIIDDPMDKDDRESEAVREKKKRWYDSLHPLLVPYDLALADGTTAPIQKMMFIATRWHLQDLVAHVLDKTDDWDAEVEGVYGKDGHPRYPEFFPESKIEAIRRKIDSVFFACQYLNNPLPEGAQIYLLERLHKLRPDQYDIRQGTNYVFLDPSRGKRGGDFPATIFVNVFNGRKVVYDAIDQKIDLAVLLGLVAKKAAQDRTSLVVFETNGAMGLELTIASALKDAKASTGVQPINESRNKEERIYAMQPRLYNGDWFFRTDHEQAYPELMKQLVFFPAWGHDDFPDVIEKGVTWIALNMPGSFMPGATQPKQTFAGSINKQLRF